jgi:hypothetical protein
MERAVNLASTLATHAARAAAPADMRTTPHLLPLLLSALATAQAAPTDLEVLARRVETAHRPDGPVPPITAFRCTLELHLLDAAAEQGGQVDLAVQFLLWQREAATRVRPLIRYEVRQAGSPIVRGRDRNGPWQLFQGEPRDLTGSEFVQDLRACDQHTNLARQLLRCLSPGEVLRSLERPTAVTTAELALDRRTRLACETVTGTLPAFPLLQRGGEEGPARLAVWVDRTTGRLTAIDAWPVAADGSVDENKAERVVLDLLHERDGLLVPRELRHLFRDEAGQFRLHSRAVLTTLALRPELRAEDFDRTRK